ncbi:MAG TPA: protein-tyrosine-phosphatase [Stellaceae bacterium]|nr:protein-tyrosine-phosphatase [Stellaceae bacterium]
MDAPAPCRTSICGIEELDGHVAAGVTHVLSLLDPGWPEPSAFAEFAPHARLDLRFHDIVDPLPGLRLPQRADVAALLRFAAEAAAVPDGHLLVHCQKGLSRSTASLALILAQARPEHAAEAIIAEVVRMRPAAWPNLRILELGDALLGRGGSLVAAVAACYRARLAARPQLADGMIEMGRARELDHARGPGSVPRP